MDSEQQRNLLLAIALSLVVLLAWSWVMNTFYPPPEEGAAPVAEQAAPTGETAPAKAPAAEQATAKAPEPAPPTTPAPAAAPPAPPAPRAPAETPETPSAEPVAPTVPPIVSDAPVVTTDVRTDDLHAVFSSLGAVLTSLQLPHYAAKRPGMEAVELVETPIEQTEGSRPLDVRVADGPNPADLSFHVRSLRPGDPEHQRLLTAADEFVAEPARSRDPIALRDRAIATVREAGASPAVAWAVGTALADVPLSREGELQERWSLVAKENRDVLATATILDFSAPWPGGATLHKVFAVSGNRYTINLDLVLVNPDGEPVQLGTEDGYTLVWGPGLAPSEPNSARDRLEAMWLVKSSLKKKSPGIGLIDKILRRNQTDIPEPFEAAPDADWFGLRRQYFMAAVRPEFEGATARFVPLAESRTQQVEMRVHVPPLRAEPGSVAGQGYLIYVGPIHGDELAAVGRGYESALHFGRIDLFGKAMLAGLTMLNNMVHSYGLAIILLTVLVRLALFPLNQRAYQSMRAMSVVQPKMSDLRERYKNNPQEMNKKVWELYREHNVNPMGGCLPIAFQMPVFFALFAALRGAIELRGANFLWIADLSEPDRLFVVSGFAVNILPICMAVAMLVQQKMSTPQANPTKDPQVEMQRKMMTWMPLLFGVMFYGMPSGLTVYWLVSTVLGIGQQYYVNKT